MVYYFISYLHFSSNPNWVFVFRGQCASSPCSFPRLPPRSLKADRVVRKSWVPTFPLDDASVWKQTVKRGMELQGSGRRREVSPNRAKACMQSNMKMFRKVQVVYYLSRNGQLEHPHFMEVSHLAGQELRLKGMNGLLRCLDQLNSEIRNLFLSLVSWSCVLVCLAFFPDVTNRLCVLRGRGMPNLFSWSCKRCTLIHYLD